jgi:hypothetical protein
VETAGAKHFRSRLAPSDRQPILLVRPGEYQAKVFIRYKTAPFTGSISLGFEHLERRAPRLSSWMVVLHKVIADHARHNHVCVFDPAHLRRGDLNVELRQRSELAAIAPGQRDGLAAD